MIHELIRNITSSLDNKGIPYMISGSMAFNMYCIPRMSMDIDLVISKLAWIQQLQSEKQGQDILMLMALPGIDSDYINDWCKKLNLNTFGLI